MIKYIVIAVVLILGRIAVWHVVQTEEKKIRNILRSRGLLFSRNSGLFIVHAI